MSDVIPATNRFRTKVSMAVATAGSVPAITHAAWGTNGAPSSPDDTALGEEVHRQDDIVVTPDGVRLHIEATLRGNDVLGHIIREVGFYDSDGELAARRTFGVVELASSTSVDVTLDMQF